VTLVTVCWADQTGIKAPDGGDAIEATSAGVTLEGKFWGRPYWGGFGYGGYGYRRHYHHYHRFPHRYYYPYYNRWYYRDGTPLSEQDLAAEKIPAVPPFDDVTAPVSE